MPQFPPAVPSKLPEEHPLCTARSSPEPLSFCLIVFLQRPPSHSLPFDLQLTRSRCLPYIALGGSGQLLKCTSPALCDLRHQFRLCSPALPVPSLRRWVLLVFCSSLLGSAGTPRVLITDPAAECRVPSGSLGLCLQVPLRTPAFQCVHLPLICSWVQNLRVCGTWAACLGLSFLCCEMGTPPPP